LNLCN